MKTRTRRRWWIAGSLVLLVLIAARLAAPMVIERAIESSLANMPDGYKGTMDGVDLRMLSAEVALLGLRIEKKNGLVPVPFLHAEELIVGTVRDSWKPRTTLRVVAPVISYVDAKNEEAKQKGPPFDLAKLHKQLPFELIAVYLERGQAHFRNFEGKPDLDVYLHDIDVAWTNLVGCLPPGSTACRSQLKGDASFMKAGHLELRGRYERKPESTFDVFAAVRDVKAAQLSPALRRYTKIDIEKGDIDLDAKYSRRGQSHSALLTPMLSGIEVMGGDKEGTSFFRELGAGAAAGWFERKSGKKAIELKSKPNGKLDFGLVDLPKKSADGPQK